LIQAADIVIEDGVVTSLARPTGDVPWWSFTKTVIAAAALALVRDGGLALDTPLDGQPYTLRQLLQHRAGVADYGPLAAYHDAVARDDDAWPVAELLARTNATRQVYPPGEGWAYSNIGYLFVRRLIEQTTGQDLGAALTTLVLRPLGVERARLAMRREDLAGVAMGQSRGYDPRWVYHGLLIGPLADAAWLLHRLMTGPFLPAELRRAMLARHPVGGPIAGRPWTVPGYGLGLMSGDVTEGITMAGHTGGGPGTLIAIYHSLSAGPHSTGPSRTAAAFSPGDDQGLVENRCALSLAKPVPRKEARN
jgi:CubicO group peptidase (beta-lactamase class C family)